MADFLRHATTNVRNPERKEGEDLMPMKDFRKELRGKMEQLRMETEFARRYVNDGFSGGEMKRAEILQLAMLQPKFAVLDETDSGLDADAVRLASESIAEIGRAKMGLLIITHHDKLLEHNPPDVTHVILGGRVVEKGGAELAVEQGGGRNGRMSEVVSVVSDDKRDFGHLLLLAGSRTYPGAALMAAKAAARSGVGLLTACVPESLQPAFAAALPEAMWVPMPETPDGGLALEGLGLVVQKLSRATALVAGPGLGKDRKSTRLNSSHW